jgi:hypothetical protein
MYIMSKLEKREVQNMMFTYMYWMERAVDREKFGLVLGEKLGRSKIEKRKKVGKGRREIHLLT